MNKHIVQLIRERFYPLVRFCGPQSAGEVEIEGVRATTCFQGDKRNWRRKVGLGIFQTR